MRRILCLLAASIVIAGCGSSSGEQACGEGFTYEGTDSSITELPPCPSDADSTPTKLDGTPSSEVRANEASDAVKDFCSHAVSEAKRVGCESYVTDDDLP